MEGPDLFEDLAPGEYFPPDLVTVSRILEIDDDEVDVLTIDWLNVPLPNSTNIISTAAMKVVEVENSVGTDGWDGVDSISPVKSKNRRGKTQKKDELPETKISSTKNLLLHGQTCWMVVKWEGLPYGEASFEDVDDLKSYCSVNSSGKKEIYSSPIKKIEEKIKLDNTEKDDDKLKNEN